MIKRYKMGAEAVNLGAATTFGLYKMVEHEHGEYVRYEDYAELLESIGAGGVSAQRISSEPSAELMAEIKRMAVIQLVNGKAELTNVREIIHAVSRATAR